MAQAEVAFHVGEAGSDHLPLPGADAVTFGLHEASGKVARCFVDIARDSRAGSFGHQRSFRGRASQLASPLSPAEQGPPSMHLRGGPENVVARDPM